MHCGLSSALQARRKAKRMPDLFYFAMFFGLCQYLECGIIKRVCEYNACQRAEAKQWGEWHMFAFDTLIDRSQTGAVKWERRTEAEKRAGIVAMSVADMEFGVAPCVREAVVRAAEHGVYGYTDPNERYFAAVKRWMALRHGWDVRAEDVTCIHGVVPAIAVCVRAFTQPGDGVIIQPPVYPPFRQMIESNGRRVLNNALINENGRYRMDYEDLERKAADPRARLMVLCSPHNPVGRVWTREELARVHEICKRHGVTVASDEIHFDLVAGGAHTVYANVDPDAIVLTAPSKTFNVPGLQLANAIIRNVARRNAFREELTACGGSNISYFGYAATCAAYEGGEEWLDALLDYLRGNEALVRDFMARRFPQVRISPMEGTYLLWLDYRALGVPDAEVNQFLRQDAGWIVNAGEMFGAEGRGFVRVNIALPRPELQKALDRLAAAAQKMGY